MTQDVMDETQAAVTDEAEVSSEGEQLEEMAEAVEGQEAETKSEEVKTDTDDEKEALKAENKQLGERLNKLVDQLNGVKADKKIVSQTAKWLMEEYGVSYDDAAKNVNLAPNDLQARLESMEAVPDKIQVFQKTYIGLKRVLDATYGSDTFEFVKAFDEYGFKEPDLAETFNSLPPEDAVAYAVREGKRILDTTGGVKLSPLQMAKRIAELEAALSVQKTDKTPVVVKKGDLPLSGVVASKPIPKGRSFYDDI